MGWIIYVTIRDTTWNTVVLDEYTGANLLGCAFVRSSRAVPPTPRPLRPLHSMTVSITPLIISGFNIVLPAIFNFMSRYEDYLTEVTTSRVNLARSYMVKMSSIYVLLFGYVGIDKSGQLGPVGQQQRHGRCRTRGAAQRANGAEARWIEAAAASCAGRRRSAKSSTPCCGPAPSVRWRPRPPGGDGRRPPETSRSYFVCRRACQCPC